MAKRKVQVVEQSPKYQLNSLDWGKIGKGALVALGGAALTYATELIPNIDWGQYTPLVVMVSSILINLLRKLLAGPE